MGQRRDPEKINEPGLTTYKIGTDLDGAYYVRYIGYGRSILTDFLINNKPQISNID